MVWFSKEEPQFPKWELKIDKIYKKEKDKKNASGEKTGATQILNKQSILNFMEFDKVEDNMIIQKGRKKIHNGCRMPRY